MSHNASIRRAASVLGATGLIALSMAAPASARPDPGTGGHDERAPGTSVYEGGTSGSSTGPLTQVLRVDDNAVEFLQLGAGILAGIALAGAGMAVASRRGHANTAHPA